MFEVWHLPSDSGAGHSHGRYSDAHDALAATGHRDPEDWVSDGSSLVLKAEFGGKDCPTWAVRSDGAAEPAAAFLVVDADGGLLAAYPPERGDRAHEHARNVGAVVAAVPVVADFRPPEAKRPS